MRQWGFGTLLDFFTGRHRTIPAEVARLFLDNEHNRLNRDTVLSIYYQVIRRVRPYEAATPPDRVKQVLDTVALGRIARPRADSPFGALSGDNLDLVLMPLLALTIGRVLGGSGRSSILDVAQEIVPPDVNPDEIRSVARLAGITLVPNEIDEIKGLLDEIFAVLFHPVALPGVSLTPIQREFLHDHCDNLRLEYALRQEKVRRMRRELAIQTQVDVEFQLDQQLAEEEDRIEKLVDRIDQIERRLGMVPDIGQS